VAVGQLVRLARRERLGYDEFLYVCQQARKKLGLRKPKKQRKLPKLLSDPELKRFPARRRSAIWGSAPTGWRSATRAWPTCHRPASSTSTPTAATTSTLRSLSLAGRCALSEPEDRPISPVCYGDPEQRFDVGELWRAARAQVGPRQGRVTQGPARCRDASLPGRGAALQP